MIEGEIAEIIDKFTVVINRGLKHGVKDEMRFVIFDEGVEIKDPTTNESLGKLEKVKGKIVIINTQEKFSSAKSDDFTSIPDFGIPPPFSSRRVPLDVDEKFLISKSETYQIKVGDKVRQIPD